MLTTELLTVDEAAKVLKLSPYTVRELLKMGKLPGVKVGGGRQWRIPRKDLEQYLELNAAGQTNVKPPERYITEEALLSEHVLAGEWLNEEEDEAWAYL